MKITKTEKILRLLWKSFLQFAYIKKYTMLHMLTLGVAIGFVLSRQLLLSLIIFIFFNILASLFDAFYTGFKKKGWYGQDHLESFERI